MSDHPSNNSLDTENILKYSKKNKQKKIGFWAKLFCRNKYNNKESDDDFEEKIIELIKNHDANNKLAGMEGRVLIHNIIEFGTLTASDVMIPRSDIISASIYQDADSLLKYFIEHGLTRIPMYDKNLDDIIGFIHIKDLINLVLNKKKEDIILRNIVRPLIFAVPSMNVIDLMIKMRNARVHMALVLDEYGGIDGLLTIEDLLEEIVGSIEDEHDENDESPEIVKIDDNTYEANARISIETLEETIGVNIFDGEEEECETLAGLIFLLSGTIPIKGQIIHHPIGIEFYIIDADPRNIKKVRIKMPSLINLENISAQIKSS